MELNLWIDGAVVQPRSLRLGVRGSNGEYTLRPTFSAQWTGLDKTVTFLTVTGAVEVALTQDTVDVPPEATAAAGEFSCVFAGYASGRRLYSAGVALVVYDRPDVDVQPPYIPTQDVYAQYLDATRANRNDAVNASKIAANAAGRAALYVSQTAEAAQRVQELVTGIETTGSEQVTRIIGQAQKELDGMRIAMQEQTEKACVAVDHHTQEKLAEAEASLADSASAAQAAAGQARASANLAEAAAKQTQQDVDAVAANAQDALLALDEVAQEITVAKTILTNVSSNAKSAADSAIEAERFAQQAGSVAFGFKGYFSSEAELTAQYPAGAGGDWALVGGSENTVWMWDPATSGWITTYKPSLTIIPGGQSLPTAQRVSGMWYLKTTGAAQ